ncbi:MAG TPA: hypothetical protein VGD65_01295 [Chryseosolibacter sp.]
MSDRLKDFIDNHREAFDDKEPSDKVWNRIEKTIFANSVRPAWYNSLGLWRAAAVIFMGLSVYLMVPKTQVAQKLAAENELVLREFTDVENFYVQQISEKVRMIDGFERSEGLNGFTKDFQQLEAMYNVLREEMKTRPSQKVKDALVLNLLVQIDLLNQHLHKLEKESNPESTEAKSKASI